MLGSVSPLFNQEQKSQDLNLESLSPHHALNPAMYETAANKKMGKKISNNDAKCIWLIYLPFIPKSQ